MNDINRLAMVSLTSRFSRSQPTMPIHKPPAKRAGDGHGRPDE